jgi:Anti-sigma-K factor rskA
MSEKHCLDLLAGYCLDALEPAEQAQAVSHLARCAECRQEAASLAECLHATLGLDCVPTTPSPNLRTQFLAHLALEDRPATSGTTSPASLSQQAMLPVPQAPRVLRDSRLRWLLAAAALPAVAALIFAAGWFNMKQQYDTQQSHLLSQALVSPHVAMVLSGPATRQGMTGEVILPTSSGGGLLILSGMSKPPSNMGYTCWVQRGGAWTAWGPLKPDASGLAMFVMDNVMDPHGASMLAITLEPMDRTVTTPTHPMLLSTSL